MIKKEPTSDSHVCSLTRREVINELLAFCLTTDPSLDEPFTINMRGIFYNELLYIANTGKCTGSLFRLLCDLALAVSGHTQDIEGPMHEYP